MPTTAQDISTMNHATSRTLIHKRGYLLRTQLSTLYFSAKVINDYRLGQELPKHHIFTAKMFKLYGSAKKTLAFAIYWHYALHLLIYKGEEE
jgi:hypothetical protein